LKIDVITGHGQRAGADINRAKNRLRCTNGNCHQAVKETSHLKISKEIARKKHDKRFSLTCKKSKINEPRCRAVTLDKRNPSAVIPLAAA
jgi:hypothetical protein